MSSSSGFGRTDGRTDDLGGDGRPSLTWRNEEGSGRAGRRRRGGGGGGEERTKEKVVGCAWCRAAWQEGERREEREGEVEPLGKRGA